MISLFRKLFHPLTRHAFWTYYMRGYRGISMVKLDDEKIRWLKWKEDGHKNSDIADGLKIIPRRVQQVYSQYHATKRSPALKTPGRRRKPITVQKKD